MPRPWHVDDAFANSSRLSHLKTAIRLKKSQKLRRYRVIISHLLEASLSQSTSRQQLFTSRGKSVEAEGSGPTPSISVSHRYPDCRPLDVQHRPRFANQTGRCPVSRNIFCLFGFIYTTRMSK